ncbi:MAG: FixH family protein [Campylobacterota bacterium]|nr:FixH family protein [Campylobacterota bacterium]
MASANNSKKTYWPHMILGFLMLAIVLGYWTIKAASSMPVQETNDYMMKYQEADMNINDILRSKQAFDKVYQIELVGAETMVMTDNVHSNRPQPNPVKLASGANHFSYKVSTKDGTAVNDAKVSFLLTRPHTVADDQMIEVVPSKSGQYVTPDLNISKAGRYTLQMRAKIGEVTGYAETAAYLHPSGRTREGNLQAKKSLN